MCVTGPELFSCHRVVRFRLHFFPYCTYRRDNGVGGFGNNPGGDVGSDCVVLLLLVTYISSCGYDICGGVNSVNNGGGGGRGCEMNELSVVVPQTPVVVGYINMGDRFSNVPSKKRK